MKVIIGSKNPHKIDAVREIFSESDLFGHALYEGIASPSLVSNQPRSLEETIRGAVNRAKNIFLDCDYSVGIESGFMEVPFTKSGHMNVTVCVIYDGKMNHIGLSSAFETPQNVTHSIMHENLELDEAWQKHNLTTNERIGYAGGVILPLTMGRLDRKEYTKEAVRMALIHIENPALYKNN